jgi:glutathione S-transferase
MPLKLNILPPSVNNMTVRVFVRAAGLEFEEENVWGTTRGEEYTAKCPSQLTPSVETEGLPKGLLWESCAVMMYLANRRSLTDLYPNDLASRAMIDSANFYTTGSFYPMLARASYPRLGFPGYPGETASSDADDDVKEASRKAADDALPRLLDVYRDFFVDEDGFIGNSTPTIADIRLACSMEFLPLTDTGVSGWVGDYLQRVEAALGDAYSEPAGDVRGFISQVPA